MAHQVADLPTITIITPTYNRADLIEETIDSILAQKYPKLDFLVLDDGSKDNTVEVMKKYHGKLRFYTHKNMGESNTDNRGFELAQGEIIGVINSDDPLLPGALRAVAEYMTGHPEVLVVYPDWYKIDGAGTITANMRSFDYSYRDMLRLHLCYPGPGAFFRKAVVEKIGGRDPQFRFVADYDFWLRAGLLGPFARIPKFLATFRVHEGGASEDKGVAMANEHLRMIDKLYARTDLPPEIVRLKRQVYSTTYYAMGLYTLTDPALRRKQFIKAIVMAPEIYFWQRPMRLLEVLPWQRQLKAIWRAGKRVKAASLKPFSRSYK